MRRSLLVLVAVLAVACEGSEPGADPTPPTTVDEQTTTTAEPTTTTTPAITTTTVAMTTTTVAPLQSLAYEEVAAADFPVQITARPGDEISYVATKDGRVWGYDGSALSENPVLDISENVLHRGEQGLLSIVLHPEETTRFFAHYSANDGDTVVSEFSLVSPTEVDPVSEEVLLRLDQPARNHNGGMIQIHEGVLYVGLGDGGGANDRFGNGQNTGTLLGGLVRISLDGEPEPNLWQYGLRNPWRFWIEDDLIYIADVGQNSFEEVNVAQLVEGLNYGWPITEAGQCFSPSSGCDTAGLTLPVIEVAHGDAGTCSITGGIVYRGASIPEVHGHYFYSDYCGGYLRSFVFEDGEAVEPTDWTDQVGVAGQVTGFGVDGEGEMYLTTTDRVLKVVAVRE